MTRRRAFSVSVFARNAGSVLLIYHKRLRAWLPPGGELLDGETPLEAARRELLEETGLAGTFAIDGGIDGAPPGLIAYEEHHAGAKGLHMNFVFAADVASRAVDPNDEFDDYCWVSSCAGIECPANVRQLIGLSLREAPAAFC